MIDSMVNTVLQGLFVLEAAKMCKAGVPMEACVKELLDMRESGNKRIKEDFCQKSAFKKSVGEKINGKDDEKDEPEDLTKSQNLILKVNDNWEAIHKLELGD